MYCVVILYFLEAILEFNVNNVTMKKSSSKEINDNMMRTPGKVLMDFKSPGHTRTHPIATFRISMTILKFLSSSCIMNEC